MRLSPAGYTALLPVLIIIFAANAWPVAASAIAAPAAISATEISSGKQATVSQNPTLLPSSEAPPRDPGQDDRPLLPQRPKDFNPLAASGSDEASALSSPPSVMAAAQFGGYFSHLISYMHLLVIIVFAVALLLAIGLFYLRGLYLQAAQVADAVRISAQITGQSAVTAQEMGEKQLRAYVSIANARGELTDDTSGVYGVRLEIKNFGATPAYNVTAAIAVLLADAEMNAVPPLPSVFQTVALTLAPKESEFCYTVTELPVATELMAVTSSQCALYACGEIRYRDVLKRERITRFRLRCQGEANFSNGRFDAGSGGIEAE